MNRRRPYRFFIIITLILLVSGAFPVFSQAPRLGTPTGQQQEINRLPALLVGGNSLKYEFGGDTWIAKVDGKNFIAGVVTARESAGLTTLLLKQTHVYLNANWVQTVGPERVLEYRAGQPLVLVPRSGWDASGQVSPAPTAELAAVPEAQTAPAAVPTSPPPATTPQPAPVPAPAPGSLAAGAAAADAAQAAMEAAFEGNPDAAMTVQRSPVPAQRYEDESAAEPPPAQQYSPAPEQTSNEANKPVRFSFGLLGTLFSYNFWHGSTKQNFYSYDYGYTYDNSQGKYKDTYFGFIPQFIVYLDLEFFSYVKLGVNIVLDYDFDFGDINLSLNPHLIVQIPFRINQKISIIPQAGLEYDMNFYDSWYGLYDDIIYNATLWLLFGARLEYGISERWIFKPELLYNIFLYSRWKSESESEHGPRINLGMEYSITEHVKFNFALVYYIWFYKYSYEYDFYDSYYGNVHKSYEYKLTDQYLDLNLGIRFVF